MHKNCQHHNLPSNYLNILDFRQFELLLGVLYQNATPARRAPKSLLHNVIRQIALWRMMAIPWIYLHPSRLLLLLPNRIRIVWVGVGVEGIQQLKFIAIQSDKRSPRDRTLLLLHYSETDDYVEFSSVRVLLSMLDAWGEGGQLIVPNKGSK